MIEDILTRIDTLDDDQAISQIRTLLQAAMRGTPAFAAMSPSTIADRLTTIAVEPETLAQAASVVRQTPTRPILTRNVGAAARELLLIFAQTNGGGQILQETLSRQEESPDLGFVTVQSVFTFLWLAVAGDLDLKLGWFRYRKRALTPDQQATLLKPVLPIAVRAVIESLAASIENIELMPSMRRSTSSGHHRVDPAALDSLRRPRARAHGTAPYA
jgi:hypothetical protein